MWKSEEHEGQGGEPARFRQGLGPELSVLENFWDDRSLV